MSGCCGEYQCRRRQPIRFYRGDLGGQVFAVTRSTQHSVRDDGTPVLRAVERHEVTEAMEAFIRREREWIMSVLESEQP